MTFSIRLPLPPSLTPFRASPSGHGCVPASPRAAVQEPAGPPLPRCLHAGESQEAQARAAAAAAASTAHGVSAWSAVGVSSSSSSSRASITLCSCSRSSPRTISDIGSSRRRRGRGSRCGRRLSGQQQQGRPSCGKCEQTEEV